MLIFLGMNIYDFAVSTSMGLLNGTELRASQKKGDPSTPMAWFVFVKKPAIWVTTCLSPQALVGYAHDWPLNASCFEMGAILFL